MKITAMDHLGFKPCLADPDVWMWLSTKTTGEEYYEYVLLYIDDALVVSHRGEFILRNELGKYFELKEDLIGPPSQYLGGKASHVTLDNGNKAWTFSSSQEAVKNVEKHLAETAD